MRACLYLLAALAPLSANAAVTLTHAYTLNNTYADSLGGPSMVPNGGSLGASGYTFSANQGPNLSSAINPDEYTIGMKFRIDDTNGYRAIVNFKNLTTDNGLYDLTNSLVLYIGGQAATYGGAFSPVTDVHLLLTRNSATNEFHTYINGASAFSYIDAGGATKFDSTANIIHFLRDNGGEQPTGFLDYVNIYSGFANSSDATAIYRAGEFASSGIPEPSTYGMLGGGILALISMRRRADRK
jgi:hypothetical protein